MFLNRRVDSKSPLFAFTEEHCWVKLGQLFFDLCFYFLLFKGNSVKIKSCVIKISFYSHGSLIFIQVVIVG